MIYGNSALKQKYGTMNGRKNSFDDSTEINVFRTVALKNPDFQKYYMKFVDTSNDHEFIPKPYDIPGKYSDVDIGIFFNGKAVCHIDVERSGPTSWVEEHPRYYKWIHFLGRKDKYLVKYNCPFFIVLFNHNLTKFVAVEKSVFQHIPTKLKWFKQKQQEDKVKEIPCKSCHIFGKNITEYERAKFK